MAEVCRSPARRRALRVALAGVAWLFAGGHAGGHAPYGQWGVYRQRYLLILTTREDPPSFALGTEVAAVLAQHLPDSKAQVSRAPHKQRIASLLSSQQMDLALMRPDDAAALRAGAPPFADYGPVPLHTIVGLGEFLLVCRDDFRPHHAWLLAETLYAHRAALPLPLSPVAPATAVPDTRIPFHIGAQAYFTGAPPPPRDADHDHGHDDGASR